MFRRKEYWSESTPKTVKIYNQHRVAKAFFLPALWMMIIIMYACGQTDKEEEWPDQRLQRWLTYYDLSLDEFEKVGRFERSYKVEHPYEPLTDNLFASLYIYSADSLLAIDLDSYHSVLEVKDDGTLFYAGREPDMEVGLINFDEGIRKRILFCGPVCMFEEAAFHPDGRIVVAGFSENDAGYKPALWFVDQKNSAVTFYQAKKPFPTKKIRYISDKRLSHIEFWFDHIDFIDQPDIPL